MCRKDFLIGWGGGGPQAPGAPPGSYAYDCVVHCILIRCSLASHSLPQLAFRCLQYKKHKEVACIKCDRPQSFSMFFILQVAATYDGED